MSGNYSLSPERVKNMISTDITNREEDLLYRWYWETNYAQEADIQEIRFAVAKKLKM